MNTVLGQFWKMCGKDCICENHTVAVSTHVIGTVWHNAIVVRAHPGLLKKDVGLVAGYRHEADDFWRGHAPEHFNTDALKTYADGLENDKRPNTFHLVCSGRRKARTLTRKPDSTYKRQKHRRVGTSIPGLGIDAGNLAS